MDKELMEELYQSLILDHSRKPRNYGRLECPHCLFSKGKNPSCGDELSLFAHIEKEHIEDIKFEGEGCSLFMSSTSLMTQHIKDKTIKEAHTLVNQFINFILKGEELPEQYEPLHIYETVNNFPLRVKCVLLPWRTLEKVLSNNQDTTIVKTE